MNSLNSSAQSNIGGCFPFLIFRFFIIISTLSPKRLLVLGHLQIFFFFGCRISPFFWKPMHNIHYSLIIPSPQIHIFLFFAKCSVSNRKKSRRRSLLCFIKVGGIASSVISFDFKVPLENGFSILAINSITLLQYLIADFLSLFGCFQPLFIN
jgi:hypothetical protein